MQVHAGFMSARNLARASYAGLDVHAPPVWVVCSDVLRACTALDCSFCASRERFQHIYGERVRNNIGTLREYLQKWFLATAKQLLSKFSSIVKAIGTATLKDVLDALDGSAGAILTCSQMLRHLTSPPCLALRKAALTLRGVDALRMPETDFLAVAEWFSCWMQERICICVHDM